MAHSRRLNRLLSPLVSLTDPIPRVALAPEVARVFAVGNAGMIVVITLLDYPPMYAGIVAVTPMGLGRYFAVDWLECWLCRWEYVD